MLLHLPHSLEGLLKRHAALSQAKEKANRVEEQLQELTTKLAAMETEKHSLAARNKVLETALATAKGMPGRVSVHPCTALCLGASCGCDINQMRRHDRQCLELAQSVCGGLLS